MTGNDEWKDERVAVRVMGARGLQLFPSGSQQAAALVATQTAGYADKPGSSVHPSNLPFFQSSILPIFQSSNLPFFHPSMLRIFQSFILSSFHRSATLCLISMKPSGWVGTIRGKPEPGATAEKTKRVDERDIELFAQITGDRNPLHFDVEAARRSVFGGLIVQGGVTSGLLNAIVAEYLPGPGTVFLSVEWKFVKAVYVGDFITGRVEITTVRDDKPICTIATSVRNQDGVICLSGTATTYTVALSNERQ
jgi:acyl dehydratase